MLSLIKKTFYLSSTYAFGDILMKGIGLLLLPLYTAYLTPNDYGILSIATVVSAITAIILTLGLNGSALRYYYKLEGTERKNFYGTLWIFLILFPGIIFFLIELSGGKLFNQLFSQVSYNPYLRLALWTSYITVAFTTLPRELFKASERAKTYVALNIGQFLFAVGMTIWFVVILKKGAEGALWARLIGTAAIGLISALLLWKHINLNFDFNLLKQALLYGLPFMPHFLAHWVLGTSDRVILERYVSLSEVGIYSVGYTIGSVMLMFAVAGNNAMIPLFGKLKKSDNNINITKLMKMVTYYILVMTIIGLGIALFSKEMIYLLTPKSYHQAIFVVPWVVLGCFFMGLYFTPMSILQFISGNTKPIPFCTGIAAGINIALNLWLIPKYGMIVAAITTAFSYFVMFLGIFVSANYNTPLPYEYRRISLIMSIGVLTFFLAWNLASERILLSIIVKFSFILLFFILLFVTNFFTFQEKQYISKKLNNVKLFMSNAIMGKD